MKDKTGKGLRRGKSVDSVTVSLLALVVGIFNRSLYNLFDSTSVLNKLWNWCTNSGLVKLRGSLYNWRLITLTLTHIERVTNAALLVQFQNLLMTLATASLNSEHVY